MEGLGLGGWGWIFSMPGMFLRWGGTMLVARNFLYHRLLLLLHIVFLWYFYLAIAYVRYPSAFSSFGELRHFLFRLPEFYTWCSIALTLKVVVAATFFLPKVELIFAVTWYLLGVYGWILYLLLEADRLLSEEATDENDGDALDGLELLASSTRKRN